MAKKQKRRNRSGGNPAARQSWKMPKPTPGDAANQPDGPDQPHAKELVRKLVDARIRDELRSRKGADRDAYRRNMGATAERAAESYMSAMSELRADYARRLAELPDALTKEDLAKMDVIDVTSFWPDPSKATAGQEEPVKAYLLEASDAGAMLYAAMPCFAKGAMIVKDDRFILFEVTGLDEERNRVEIYLDMYQSGEAAPDRYIRCVAGPIGIEIEPSSDGGADLYCGIDDEKIIAAPEILAKIPPRDLPWGPREKQFWELVVLQNAVDQAARCKANQAHGLLYLGQQFTNTIITVNYLLSRHRPVMERPANADGTRKAPTKTPVAPTKPPPKRSVRVVGPVRLASVRPPKAPDGKSARNYVRAAWTVRGHTRKYKSGKTIYVKPHVNKRRSLDAGAEPLPSTVRIAANGTESEETK